MSHLDIPGFVPEWSLPSNIKCFVTSRDLYLSRLSKVSFDLSEKSDHKKNTDNLHILRSGLLIKKPITRLNQTHSNKVINTKDSYDNVNADGIFSFNPQSVCIILTADCIPVLCYSEYGGMVAAIHCGWKGLVGGVIEQFMEEVKIDSQKLHFWLGPSICKECYEIKEDFIAELRKNDIDTRSLINHNLGRMYMDLKQLCQDIIVSFDVGSVVASQLCTICNNDQFFSYRKEKTSKRFASMIWIDH
jgi:YfiH family protein